MFFIFDRSFLFQVSTRGGNSNKSQFRLLNPEEPKFNLHEEIELVRKGLDQLDSGIETLCNSKGLDKLVHEYERDQIYDVVCDALRKAMPRVKSYFSENPEEE